MYCLHIIIQSLLYLQSLATKNISAREVYSNRGKLLFEYAGANL